MRHRLLAFALVALATFGQSALAATVLDDAAMRDRAAAAVVLLIVENGYGAGFVLNAHGHIATNHHVVAGGGRIVARHGERTALAEKVWSSERLDLAVLRVRVGSLGAVRALPLAVTPPAVLLDVLAVGFPGVANAVTAASAPSYKRKPGGRACLWSCTFIVGLVAPVEPVCFHGHGLHNAWVMSRMVACSSVRRAARDIPSPRREAVRLCAGPCPLLANWGNSYMMARG